ncbi:unnamed protein product [Rangifer tarandus platyrhynchus]|uniref:Uncharacterized protein n=2 Tax=Rangifer tarandus platyrhynchus TaxID=3082113 RepID=A0ABN8YSM6_RANTA|nr:unnamed protein product [Rangifer tarandus platyrhynchus]CAI9702210.1 unnamed protein product [Rangifer tarandus platyrhynchus]
MRGGPPGVSARRCPAGAALWRAVHTLPARAGARLTFSGGLAGRSAGRERLCVCAARPGARASPQPHEETQPVRFAPQGQRPVTAAFVAGEREPEPRGCGRRRAPLGSVSWSPRAAEGVLPGSGWGAAGREARR